MDARAAAADDLMTIADYDRIISRAAIDFDGIQAWMLSRLTGQPGQQRLERLIFPVPDIGSLLRRLRARVDRVSREQPECAQMSLSPCDAWGVLLVMSLMPNKLAFLQPAGAQEYEPVLMAYRFENIDPVHPTIEPALQGNDRFYAPWKRQCRVTMLWVCDIAQRVVLDGVPEHPGELVATRFLLGKHMAQDGEGWTEEVMAKARLTQVVTWMSHQLWTEDAIIAAKAKAKAANNQKA